MRTSRWPVTAPRSPAASPVARPAIHSGSEPHCRTSRCARPQQTPSPRYFLITATALLLMAAPDHCGPPGPVASPVAPTNLASKLHHRTVLRTATTCTAAGQFVSARPCCPSGYERNHNHTTTQCLLRPVQIFTLVPARQSPVSPAEAEFSAPTAERRSRHLRSQPPAQGGATSARPRRGGCVKRFKGQKRGLNRCDEDGGGKVLSVVSGTEGMPGAPTSHRPPRSLPRRPRTHHRHRTPRHPHHPRQPRNRLPAGATVGSVRRGGTNRPCRVTPHGQDFVGRAAERAAFTCGHERRLTQREWSAPLLSGPLSMTGA